MAKSAVVRVVAETQQYDRKIEDAAKKLQDFGKNGLGSLSSLAGGWGKLVPAIGAAVGAHQLFDKALNNSQALQETFERTQLQMKTAVDNFFAALTSGDWSAFDAGISGIIAKAGDAANALDQLGNSLMSLGVVNAKEGLEYQQAMTRLRGAKKGTEEYSEALKDAKKAVESMNAATDIVKSDQWGAIATQVASWTNLGANEIKFDWVLNAQTLDSKENRDELKEQAAKNVKTYHEEVARLNKEYFETVSGDWSTPGDVYQRVKAGKNVEDYDAAIARLNETYGESIVTTTLLNKKNDETLEGLDQLTIAYYGNAKAIENYRTQLARLEKGEEGGGGGGGKTVKVTVEPLGLDEISAEIAKIQENANGIGDSVSIERLQKLLKDAQTAAANAVGTSAQAEAQAVVNTIQTMLNDRELTVKARIAAIDKSMTHTIEVRARIIGTDGVSGITGLSDAASNMDTSGVDAYCKKMEKANEISSQWKQLMGSEMQTAVGGLTNAMSGLGNAIGGTTGAMVELVASMMQQVAQTAITISSLMAEEAAHKKNMTAAAGEAAAKTMAAHSWIPFVGIAIGLGMVATLIASLQGLPKFAEGGVATKATLGVFGEAGPEAIIPLDRLERMLGTSERRNGREDGLAGRVEFRIKDTELVGVLQKSAIRSARTAVR